MTTTLTREQLFEKAKARYEEIDVPGFGKVGIRSRSEVKRCERMASVFDGNGVPIPDMHNLRRVHMILDQTMVDESTPMFTELDIDTLRGLDSEKLDPLVAAITEFNGDEEKNESAGSIDTSES